MSEQDYSKFGMLELKTWTCFCPEYDVQGVITELEVYHSNTGVEFPQYQRLFVGRILDAFYRRIKKGGRDEMMWRVSLLGGYEFDFAVKYVKTRTERVGPSECLVVPFDELSRNMQMGFIRGRGLLKRIPRHLILHYSGRRDSGK